MLQMVNKMEKEQAIKNALKSYPIEKMVVKSVKEMDDYFVVSLVPKDYKKEYGIYIGGGIRVDKKTGVCRLYNPLTEK